MKFYFLTHINMSKKANILATIATATALTTAPVNAEKVETQKLNKSMELIACKTKLACEKLSISIQAQIEEIENKTTLTKEDKRLRYNLKKQLIAVENNKQEQQKDTIETQEQIKSQLASIKGSL